MTARRKILTLVAAAAVALAVALIGIVLWNVQSAAAAEESTCEKVDGAACADPESCCADTENVLKELGRV